jgi:hypothetical protein
MANCNNWSKPQLFWVKLWEEKEKNRIKNDAIFRLFLKKKCEKMRKNVVFE